MEYKLIFFDFEVFKYDWLATFRDDFGRSVTIVNNEIHLKQFYEKYKNHIFVGYNCRHYDQYIFKGILLGLDPYEISQYIIVENKQGYTYSTEFRSVQLYIYDTMFRQIGLKTLEGFMGLSIHESPVPFDINRRLTKDEIRDVSNYCSYDVICTKEIFKHTNEEFEAHTMLLEMFNRPIREISKTIASVSVSIFGASYHNKIVYHDEFNLQLPEIPTLKKYRCVLDWFNNPKNHNYKELKPNSKGELVEKDRELIINVAGLEHVFRFGGAHASADNTTFEGIIVHADVDGYYPNIMTLYNTLSRNIPNVEEIKRLLKKRIEYKVIKDKRQLPIKRALNSLFGKSKEELSPAYDPRQANRTCIFGQLFITDLIELIEDYITLINTNTDGIIFKVEANDDLEIIKYLCSIWESRTGFRLSFKLYTKIIQKDVNNYILINESDNKFEVKSKGAYVKKLSEIDNDLPIVNMALINYFTKNIAVEDTINNCNDLIQFQQLCKVSNKYIGAMYLDKLLNDRIFRVFAVIENGGTIWKMKKVDKESEPYYEIFDAYDTCDDFKELASQMDILSLQLKKDNHKPISSKVAERKYINYKRGYRLEKIQNTPEKCIIDNGDVRHKKVFSNLDKNWYINLANERIKDFIIGTKKKGGVSDNE